MLLALILALSACAPGGDRLIAKTFATNRALFDRIVAAGISTNLSCYEESSGHVFCSIPDLKGDFDALRKATGVISIFARHDLPDLGDCVYFVLESRGVISVNSSRRGVIYSKTALQPVVADTEDSPELRFRFHPIADHWYVFEMP